MLAFVVVLAGVAVGCVIAGWPPECPHRVRRLVSAPADAHHGTMRVSWWECAACGREVANWPS